MNESIVGRSNNFMRNITNNIIRTKYENGLNVKDRAFGELFAQTQIFQLYIESLKDKYSDNVDNY
jgi:hypothetical protein